MSRSDNAARVDNLIDSIIAYEEGDLDEESTIKLFQRLIDTGQAWTLQGSYGRMAMTLIEAGHCTLPERSVTRLVCNNAMSRAARGGN